MAYQRGLELLLQKLLTYFANIVYIVPKHYVLYNFLLLDSQSYLLASLTSCRCCSPGSLDSAGGAGIHCTRMKTAKKIGGPVGSTTNGTSVATSLAVSSALKSSPRSTPSRDSPFDSGNYD